MFGKTQKNTVFEDNIHNLYHQTVMLLNTMEMKTLKIGDEIGGTKTRFALLCQFAMLKLAVGNTNSKEKGFAFLNTFANDTKINLLDVYNSLGHVTAPLTWNDFKPNCLSPQNLRDILLDMNSEMARLTLTMTKRMATFQKEQYGVKHVSHDQLCNIGETSILFCDEIKSITSKFEEILSNFCHMGGEITDADIKNMRNVGLTTYRLVLLDGLIETGAVVES